MRNWLYDLNVLKSSSFGLPLICVGNLAAGGTGKSPMVEFLVEKLNNRYGTAILSRGYKRKTKGYALAHSATTALEIGDEPMQFHLKFPEVAVAVGESRLEAIPQLLHDRPGTQVIILDDAFQHRAVRAGLNILLTERSRLYTRDFFLPVGYLRDQKKSATRAEIIVVTKCEASLGDAAKSELARELKPRKNQDLFFTTLDYGSLFHIAKRSLPALDGETAVLLITGIANPGPLNDHLLSRVASVEMMRYNDHHIYTIDDLRQIRKKFDELKAVKKIMITTEKDAVRLHKFDAELQSLPLFVLPVRHRFLFNDEERFLSRITTFIEKKN